MKRFILILFCILLFGCTYADTPINANGTLAQTYAGVEQIHFNETQTNINGVRNILVIGDSISYGTGASNMINSFAYIMGGYMMCFISNALYWNASVGGQTTTQGLAQLNSCPFVPDILFIHFGMNDCVYLTTENYKANMRGIIERAKEINPRIKIVLISTIIPAINFYHSTEKIKLLPQFENALYELKSEYSNISVTPLMSYSAVMINNGCAVSGYMTGDGVHPNDTMHRLMAIECLRTIGLWNY